MATRPTPINIPTNSNGWIGWLIFQVNDLNWKNRSCWRATTTSSPTAQDARNPAAWSKDALFLPQTREKFRALVNLGLTDAIRAVSDAGDLYTFWDYQAGALAKDDGIRIDHLLLSPQATDRLIDAGIDRHVRSWDKPSDHVPVFVDLDIEGR